jgi:hypothetical protein
MFKKEAKGLDSLGFPGTNNQAFFEHQRLRKSQFYNIKSRCQCNQTFVFVIGPRQSNLEDGQSEEIERIASKIV